MSEPFTEPFREPMTEPLSEPFAEPLGEPFIEPRLARVHAPRARRPYPSHSPFPFHTPHPPVFRLQTVGGKTALADVSYRPPDRNARRPSGRASR